MYSDIPFDENPYTHTIITRDTYNIPFSFWKLIDYFHKRYTLIPNNPTFSNNPKPNNTNNLKQSNNLIKPAARFTVHPRRANPKKTTNKKYTNNLLTTKNTNVIITYPGTETRGTKNTNGGGKT